MLVLVVRRFAPMVALFVASACLLVAQSRFPMPLGRPEQDTKSADVRELVSKYCRLDYDAARIDGKGWAKIEPLVTWHANPEYSEINVIARYTADAAPVSDNGKYTVTVHYRLLGTYNLSMGYVPEAPNAIQDVDFTVTDTNGSLRISDIQNTLPHPSRAAMLKWLNDRMSETQDEHAKTLYQEALHQLEAQPASPFAK
jgi:hypothetical protein